MPHNLAGRRATSIIVTLTFVGIMLMLSGCAFWNSERTLQEITPVATATTLVGVVGPPATAKISVTHEMTTAVSSTGCTKPLSWVAYRVDIGDTLSVLAATSGATVDEIKAANCLVSDRIDVLQFIFLPSLPVQPSPTPTTCALRTEWNLYQVQAGDTLESLSSRFRVNSDVLSRANCNLPPVPGRLFYVPPVQVVSQPPVQIHSVPMPEVVAIFPTAVPTRQPRRCGGFGCPLSSVPVKIGPPNDPSASCEPLCRQSMAPFASRISSTPEVGRNLIFCACNASAPVTGALALDGTRVISVPVYTRPLDADGVMTRTSAFAIWPLTWQITTTNRYTLVFQVGDVQLTVPQSVKIKATPANGGLRCLMTPFSARQNSEFRLYWWNAPLGGASMKLSISGPCVPEATGVIDLVCPPRQPILVRVAASERGRITLQSNELDPPGRYQFKCTLQTKQGASFEHEGEFWVTAP